MRCRKYEPVCAFCRKAVPPQHDARTTETPPNREPLPSGSGWVVCGPSCPGLPSGAEVYYQYGSFRR